MAKAPADCHAFMRPVCWLLSDTERASGQGVVPAKVCQSFRLLTAGRNRTQKETTASKSALLRHRVFPVRRAQGRSKRPTKRGLEPAGFWSNLSRHPPFLVSPWNYRKLASALPVVGEGEDGCHVLRYMPQLIISELAWPAFKEASVSSYK